MLTQACKTLRYLVIFAIVSAALFSPLANRPAQAHLVGAAWATLGAGGWEFSPGGMPGHTFASLTWNIIPRHPVYRVCHKPRSSNVAACNYRQEWTWGTSMTLRNLLANELWEFEIWGWNVNQRRWGRHLRGCFIATSLRGNPVTEGTPTSGVIGSCRWFDRVL